MTRSSSPNEWDPWTYRRDAEMSGDPPDLAGFVVEATDGNIGTVEKATYDVGSSHVVVDAGPWIFGGKLMLPAGIVNRVDRDGRKVYVDRGKNEIKNAPVHGKDNCTDSDYLDRLGEYYGKFHF